MLHNSVPCSACTKGITPKPNLSPNSGGLPLRKFGRCCNRHFFCSFLPLTSQEWLLGGVVSRRFASRRFVFCKGCERPSLFSWRYHGQCLVVVRSTNACLLLCGIVRVLVAGLDRGIVDISLGTFMAGVMHGPSLRTPLVCYCHFSRSWRRAGLVN